jgi:O-antigen ligase
VTINFDWYRKFLVIFTVAVFYTSVCDRTGNMGINALKWIYLLTVLSGPVVLHAVFGGSYRLPPLVIWGVGFLLVSFVWYLPGLQDSEAFRQLRLRVLAVLFMFLVFLIMARAEEQRFARLCVAAGVIFGTALNIYELFNPMTWSNVPGRSSGFYTNIDQTGGALVLGMIVSQSALPKKLRVPFVLIAAVGIVTTFSRASILGWILVVGFWAVRSGINPRKIGTVLFVLALLFGFFTSSYWSNLQTQLEERGSINAQVLQRIAFFTNKGEATDHSADERKALTKAALRKYQQHPILGQGTGVGTAQSLEGFGERPHNVYLAMGIDHGVVGLLLLPLMVLAMIWRLPRSMVDIAVPMALFVLMWGFFSHTVFEERYLLLTVSLVSALIFRSRLALAADRHRSEQSSHFAYAHPVGAPA